jgi:hypothetical protein
MFSVGDYVIFTKPITSHYNKKGCITEVSIDKQGKLNFYRVIFLIEEYDTEFKLKVKRYTTCNIFDHVGEKIELDKIYYRNKKLEELLL